MSSLMRRLHKVAAMFMAIGIVLTSQVWGGKIQLPAGQEMKVKFDRNQELSSGKLKKGDKVSFTLAEPITIAGRAIIEQGAKGTAKVEDVTGAKPFKGGVLKVSFDELHAKGDFKTPKDAAIKLEGTVEKKGGNRKILSVIPGFFFLIKGGQGKLNPDEVYTAKVKEAAVLESK